MHRSLAPGSQQFYGWTPSPPDPLGRDVVWSAPPSLTTLPPAFRADSPNWPAPWSPSWMQANNSSCGPHSIGRNIVGVGFGLERRASMPMPSRSFIYWAARKIMGTLDQDSGVNNRSLFKAIAQYGWCDEDLMPYVGDGSIVSLRPSQAALAQAATRRIDGYANVPQEANAMKARLVSGGLFVLGFRVYRSFESPQTVSTGFMQMPRGNQDFQVGGHDVCVVGYDDALQFPDGNVGGFIFDNSYGPEWGAHGFGYMPYAYAMHPQLAGDFWTEVKSGTVAPPVVPVVVPPIVPAPPITPPIPSSTRHVITITGAAEIWYDGGKL